MCTTVVTVTFITLINVTDAVVTMFIWATTDILVTIGICVMLASTIAKDVVIGVPCLAL